MNISHLNLIEPIEKEINGKTFILSKFPAWDGREIIAKYAVGFIDKLNDYDKNKEIALKLMKYVAVPVGETAILVSNEKIINSHIPSWSTQVKLEAAMLDYNEFFFPVGNVLNLLEDLGREFQQKISKTSMASSAALSQVGKPLSENSKQSTV